MNLWHVMRYADDGAKENLLDRRVLSSHRGLQVTNCAGHDTIRTEWVGSVYIAVGWQICSVNASVGP